MSAMDILNRAITRYKIHHLDPLAIVAVSESMMMRIREELKPMWEASTMGPFPPIEAFLAGEVEVLGVRLVHQIRVCSIV